VSTVGAAKASTKKIAKGAQRAMSNLLATP
jgi:hypothetical protein